MLDMFLSFHILVARSGMKTSKHGNDHERTGPGSGNGSMRKRREWTGG